MWQGRNKWRFFYRACFYYSGNFPPDNHKNAHAWNLTGYVRGSCSSQKRQHTITIHVTYPIYTLFLYRHHWLKFFWKFSHADIDFLQFRFGAITQKVRMIATKRYFWRQGLRHYYLHVDSSALINYNKLYGINMHKYARCLMIRENERFDLSVAFFNDCHTIWRHHQHYRHHLKHRTVRSISFRFVLFSDQKSVFRCARFGFAQFLFGFEKKRFSYFMHRDRRNR